MLIEERSNRRALYTCSFAMNETHFQDSGSPASLQKFLYDAGDVLGLERMKIKNIVERENDRFVKGRVNLRHRFKLDLNIKSGQSY
jgi:hypothetical protein